MPQNIYLHSALDWVRPWWRSDFGNHSFLCRRGLELQLAAVLHGQGSHWLPPCGPPPASHPLRVAKRSPKTSFLVLLLAHDFLENRPRELDREHPLRSWLVPLLRPKTDRFHISRGPTQVTCYPASGSAVKERNRLSRQSTERCIIRRSRNRNRPGSQRACRPPTWRRTATRSTRTRRAGTRTATASSPRCFLRAM